MAPKPDTKRKACFGCPVYATISWNFLTPFVQISKRPFDMGYDLMLLHAYDSTAGCATKDPVRFLAV